MKIDLYVIDAFTGSIFGGNPAAVCPLDEWLPDAVMQNIAVENNLSETAFFVPEGDRFRIRWFTPSVEMDLCGHATLASGYVLFNQRGFTGTKVEFESRSGLLSVERESDILYLDFPSRPPQSCAVPEPLVPALGAKPAEILAARDYLVVYHDEKTVRELSPDMNLLGKLDKAVIVTAPGDDCDFVSRFFAPVFGIDEDPVTGSSHCTLIPYWAERLSKLVMTALQVSKRGGKLYCRYEGKRVKVGGKAVTYLEGTISI
ncbi:MAG: PhzF family phenazine biosynthesis protein [Dehalococcoidales bacterium]|nr:PhzF family phenazine biosynthesis protein [Dehalococcoidales bacterium]